jgi:hypothetical protein
VLLTIQFDPFARGLIRRSEESGRSARVFGGVGLHGAYDVKAM